MEDDNLKTYALLDQWHAGDGQALNEILKRDLPWIREHVQRRLGDALRAKAETQDFVQDAMVEVLKYGPRFKMSDRQHFRALMARIIENVMRGKHAWFHAERRHMAKEKPLPSDTMLNLDPPQKSMTRPSGAIERDERRAWVRLAMELLDPEDREIILLRQWEEKSFAAIAGELGLSEDAARMRFHRALPKLLAKVKQLRDGKLETLLEGL